MTAPLLFAVAAASLCTAPRSAQGADPVPETFRTADGIQLNGLFHKSEKSPNTDPVVILLYPPGKGNDMDKGAWKDLANMLAKEGFNVFRFDWRGHGKSKDIKDPTKFWNLATPQRAQPNPFTAIYNTRLITGAPLRPNAKIKNEFDIKDLRGDPVRYLPMYILDLAAVRHHLDVKNDAGDVNMSSVYLIGAEAAAPIGMAWMATEWHRPATLPPQNQFFGSEFPTYVFVPQTLNGGITTEAGTDISAAVWLSPTRPASVPEPLIKTWVAKTAPKMRDTPMLFLYGDKDNSAKRQAEFFYKEVLVAEPKGGALQKLDQTFIREVKNAGDLSGVKLLGDNNKLKTEDTILQFIAAIQGKARAKLIRKNRGFTEPWFIQLIGNGGFGFPMP
jgi:hypothetical protein